MQQPVGAGRKAKNRGCFVGKIVHESSLNQCLDLNLGQDLNLAENSLIINTHKDLLAGIELLAGKEPRFGALAAQIDLDDEELLPLRRWQPSFASLAKIIIGQQVSTASAQAINGRLEAQLGEVTAEHFLQAGEEGWKAAGLSRPKQKTLETIAEMIGEGQLDLAALGALPVDEARSHLLEIKGIGPWTAELFLLTCVGNGDAFPAGDIALQEAARDLFALERRPDTIALTGLAQAWSPWRAVAARLLWARYRQMKKGREGAVT